MNNTVSPRRFAVTPPVPAPARVFVLRIPTLVHAAPTPRPALHWTIDGASGRPVCRWLVDDRDGVVDLALERARRIAHAPTSGRSHRLRRTV